MTEIKVVLIDDLPSFVDDMAGYIQKAAGAADVKTDFIKIAEYASKPADRGKHELLNQFLQELSAVRNDGTTGTEVVKKLESADLIFVDYDLRRTTFEGGLINGELVAQLIREFVKAGPIVSVDRRQIPVFELSFRHPLDTYADFMLHVDDLKVKGLWGGGPRGYDPWYWPNLVETSRNFEKRVEFAANHFDEEVVPSLGFPQDVIPILPAEDSRLGIDFREATFADVAKSWLPPLEVKTGKTVAPDCLHRIGASVVGRWLQSVVLPPQDFLIDAAHLVRHCPGLLHGEATASNLARLAQKRTDAPVPLDTGKLRRHRFPHEHEFWLDRPVWWLSSILQDRGIEDIREPWNKKPLKLEFAEDASRFWNPSDMARYESEGFFATRYVRGVKAFPDVQYVPANRLAAA